MFARPGRLEYDVVVVGSGGAGSAAAATAAASGARVLVVSKDPLVCSDSKIAEGIVTVRASGSELDTEQALSSNLRLSGDDINDPTLTAAFAKDSPSSYAWLREQGLKPELDRLTGKPVGLPMPMGGHTLPRSIDHENGGLDYAHACWNALTRQAGIDYLEDAWFLDVCRDDSSGEVLGGLVYHAAAGELIMVKAPAVVIACGGLGTLYFPHTDTMRGNTGDAYAIAARAGAKLVDMEQIQFIPFAVTSPPSYEGLVIGEPVSAGLLGVIRDVNGKLVKGELMVRTRAECAAAIAIAVAEGRGTPNGGCYLDLTENAKGRAGEIFKSIMNDKLGGILDIVKPALGKKAANFEEPWEVGPSAHYCMGGVCSTDQGQALDAQNRIIPGLYVAGQALGGLHGSNRLGSTSLAEGVIFGRRAGQGAASFSLASGSAGALPDALAASVSQRFEHCANALLADYAGIPARAGQYYPIHLIRDLQASCWQGIGPARTGRGIRQTLADINRIEGQLELAVVPAGLDWNQGFINYIECRNMLQCARQIAACALFRTRTLGAHVRLDMEKGGKKPLFSVSCHLDGAAGLKVGALPRPASPRAEKIRAALALAFKKAFLKLLQILPQRWRDPLLVKIYISAMGKAASMDRQEVPA